MGVVEILKSVETGASSSMGQLELLLAFGSVLGNMMTEGGAADCITTILTAIFGKRIYRGLKLMSIKYRVGFYF